jgi:uncharacterized protein
MDFDTATECFERGDYGEAVRLFQRGAQAGQAPSQNELGYCYRKGLGVPQDACAAFQLYSAAAHQNCGAAQNNLAMLFLNGEGCKQSSATALHWCREAAKNGDVTGFSNLMQILWDGWKDIKADRREAVRCYRTAPKDTRAAALLRRARSYDSESDGQPDYEKAFKW